jgi:ribosomal protein S18 acetylase RimI-like enzyme
MSSSHFDIGLRESAAAVRPIRSDDRPQIEKLLRASPNFTPEEVETALELIDDTLEGDPEYIIHVVEREKVDGYECHGPTPLTEGTFDLYWIVVDPEAQKRGYGRLLLRAAEEDAAKRGGRLLLIETSSQPAYDATVRFYKRNGYRLEARVHDFYHRGDDKLILAKDL